MNPDDASHGDESHRRQNHESVVLIAHIVESLWHHCIAKNGAGAKQLTEESDNDENYGVAKTVADAVEKSRPRAVAQCKGLKATHKNTIGDYESDEHRQLLADVVVVGNEELLHDDNESGYHHQLHNDANGGRNGLANERDDDIGKGKNRCD